jgi:hypothetical protein
MPRGPRLDAPGVLPHGMVRGLERTGLFRDRQARDEFVRRLAAAAPAGGAAVDAGALLANPGHRLLRTGPVPLARRMGAVLTGDAGAFNRRHRRGGISFSTETSPAWSRRTPTSWSSSATCL